MYLLTSLDFLQSLTSFSHASIFGHFRVVESIILSLMVLRKFKSVDPSVLKSMRLKLVNALAVLKSIVTVLSIKLEEDPQWEQSRVEMLLGESSSPILIPLIAFVIREENEQFCASIFKYFHQSWDLSIYTCLQLIEVLERLRL